MSPGSWIAICLGALLGPALPAGTRGQALPLDPPGRAFAPSQDASSADGWPGYRRDARRSAVTPVQLDLPLQRQWVHRPPHRPRPSWPPPARGSYWQQLAALRPRVEHDRTWHLAVQGDAVVYGSSADDRLTCLDLASGRVRWSATTDGPIRFAPQIHDGRVYAGSDDGCVWCLDLADGSTLWRQRVAPQDRRVPGHGRLISAWPVRTGLLVLDGLVYCTAGLFPSQGAWIAALDAADGSLRWRRPIEAFSPQGYLLASATRLYVPNGRSSPFVLDRADGRMLHSLPGAGGNFALLVDQDQLVSGPGNDGTLTAADAATRDVVSTFPGDQMVVTPTWSYLLAQGRLTALERGRYQELVARRGEVAAERARLAREGTAADDPRAAARAQRLRDLATEEERLRTEAAACFRWTVECGLRDALVLAGDLLIAGGEGAVVAHAARDGARRWEAAIDGAALGLAVASDRLLVSTDRGEVLCFAHGSASGAAPDPAPADVEPLPREVVATALRILVQAGRGPGFCVLLEQDPLLAAAVVERSRWTVVAFDREAVDVAQARDRLRRRRLDGGSASVHHVAEDRLPATSCFANVVVRSTSASTWPEAEAWRLVRPEGGMLVTLDPGESVQVRRRGSLAGGGEWTHAYADPGNTASSGDRLVDGTGLLQWFGEPGPLPMVDRHLRTAPPLVHRGRLLVPGNDQLIAVDAYNGTALWQLEVPGFTRTGMPFDGGHLAAGPEEFHVAAGAECLVVDAASGRVRARRTVPGDRDREWGHVTLVDGRLFGSGQRPGASRRAQSRPEVVAQYRDFNELVTGDLLFALDADDGRLLWRRGQGVFLAPSIAFGEGLVFLLESTDDAVRDDADGRVGLEAFFGGSSRLLALRQETGDVVWERPFAPAELRHVVYLCVDRGVLVAVGSTNRTGTVWYTVFAFDAATGEPLWQGSHENNRRGTGGDHGEQVHHPVLTRGMLFAEPAAYDLRTGLRIDPAGGDGPWSLPVRGGCGTVSGSAQALFFRDSSPSCFRLGAGGGPGKVTTVSRPGCWISMIPAGGLLVLPEASSGCVCSFPLQTSMAFLAEGQ